MARKSDQEAATLFRKRLIQIWEQFGSCDPDFSKREEALKRMNVELLRGKIPCRPVDFLRLMLADELEHCYFPSAHRNRAERRQVNAAIYRENDKASLRKRRAFRWQRPKSALWLFTIWNLLTPWSSFFGEQRKSAKKEATKKSGCLSPTKTLDLCSLQKLLFSVARILRGFPSMCRDLTRQRKAGRA